MILYLELDCKLYESFSLKDKRSVVKRLTTKIKKDFNVSIAELDYHELWQRAKLGVVTIANEKRHAEKVLQEIIRLVDSYSEMEQISFTIEEI